MKDFVKREVAPGKKLAGKDMEDFVRNGATTYFHQSGTCRMGTDSEAVVDAKLRVNGVQGLRIADRANERVAGARNGGRKLESHRHGMHCNQPWRIAERRRTYYDPNRSRNRR